MHCLSEQRWIENVLSKFDQNEETQAGGNQESLMCKVYNVKVYDEPVDGVGGVMEVHDTRLYIKAYFTVDAIATFQEKEKEKTSCMEFTGLWKSIIVLKKYRIVVHILEKIEDSDVAVRVEDFALVGHGLSPSVRKNALLSVLSHPKVMQGIQNMWWAKYTDTASADPVTQSGDSSESDCGTQMSDMSKLIEALNVEASEEPDHWPCCQGPYVTRTTNMKAYFELDLDDPEVKELGLDNQGALKLAVLDILYAQKGAPIAWTCHDKCPKSGKNFVIKDLPVDENVDSPTGTTIFPEHEIPDTEREKLKAIEMQPDDDQEGTPESESSPSNEVISFLPEPSLQDQAQGEPNEDMNLQTDHLRPKRKLYFDQTDRCGKVARNSGVSVMGVADVGCRKDSPKKTAGGDLHVPEEAPSRSEDAVDDKNLNEACTNQTSDGNILDKEVSEDILPSQECSTVHKVPEEHITTLSNEKTVEGTVAVVDKQSVEDIQGQVESCIPNVHDNKMPDENLHNQGHSSVVSMDPLFEISDGESPDQKDSMGTKATTKSLVESTVTKDQSKNSLEGNGSDSWHSMDLEESPKQVTDNGIPQKEHPVQAKSTETLSQPMAVDGQTQSQNTTCFSSQEDPLKILCDCLTPATQVTNKELQQPQDHSPASELDSSDTFLSVSCEVHVGNGKMTQKEDEATEVLPSQTPKINPESASTFDDKQAMLPTNSSHPVQDAQISTQSSCIKTSRDAIGTPKVQAQAISNTICDPHELGKTHVSSSNIHATRKKLTVQPDVVEVKRNSKHGDVHILKGKTCEPAQHPCSKEVYQSSACSHSRFDHTPKTQKSGLFSSVISIKPLPTCRKRTATNKQASNVQPTANREGCLLSNYLRSPTVFRSIPTPVHSLTSHQPPKLRRREDSESSISTSTSTSESDSSLSESDDRSIYLSNFKVEDHILDWCLSYFCKLTAPKQNAQPLVPQLPLDLPASPHT